MLYDKVLRVLQREASSEHELSILDKLSKSEVFEVSNVLNAIDEKEDLTKLIRKPIQKRPPFKYTWAEWYQESDFDGEYWHRGKFGALIVTITDDDIRKCGTLIRLSVKLLGLVESGANETYVVYGFADITQARSPKIPLGLCDGGMSNVQVADDSTTFRGGGYGVSFSHMFPALPKVSVPHPFRSGEEVPIVHAYVPIITFQFLHCKNIITETVNPPSRLQRATLKRGRIPLCSYKVLKVMLPEHAISNGESGQSDRQVRMHLVRGHFKYLKDDRYKNKGWHWWPAHARGSAELGMIKKEYEVGIRETNSALLDQ